MVVRGLLESAGIEADMKSIDATQDAFPGVGGTVILVREEDADEASKIIESYRQSPTSDDDSRRDQWISATSGVTALPSR